VKFNTFAYYRIRGNVIDYLRKIDKMPRVKRATYGKAQQVMERLSQELGREATDEEIANELEISLDDYYKLLMSVQQRSILSLDYTMYDEDSGREMSDMIEDQEIERPDAGMDRDSMQQKLKAHIKQLKDRDRLVLALYYYEDLTLSEIAQLLDLTEARISQIVGKLLLQLRSSMQQTTA
jgi:RNA polymerase sigma factor for flagellar operon FliA